ncbi:MAG: ABC transporter permease [Bacteroidales bacterium]|jgi:phospholipid/cholesterol/gamma-HCH transport system permease protein|nr:ABC transporter permease [Bacteroidales bacterium]MDD2570629.1 ABC transporter permease [Bacteroidales bacterium]MDD3384673.1 ABC transporter permease [Bacteroidales bacterium]MDD3810774.1 ABC transporter permease [Bacteroidales bacterium]MDD3871048.1 ABC transporter permease [Bacteroidales bacterium]
MGRYLLFIRQLFRKPEKLGLYTRQVLAEIDKLGVSSLGIVGVISFFIGMVVIIHLTANLGNPLIPDYYNSYTTRDVLVLEFSSTVLCLILAGKVGSNIASEIGTMRVTEQIDALDAMGINSAAYLVMPKVIGLMVVVPLLVILSIFIGLIGGWFIAVVGNLMTTNDYLFGIRFNFDSYKVLYTLVKSFVFAFLITSIAGYHGYYTKGGALEVGRSSTLAVVYGMISILIANYLITQIMLS